MCYSDLGVVYERNPVLRASRPDINYPNNSIIVSFDARLETFSIIKVPSKVLPMGYKKMTISRL